MEYALPVAISTLFAIIFCLRRPKIRGVYAPYLQFDDFVFSAKTYVRRLEFGSVGKSFDSKRIVTKARLCAIKLSLNKFAKTNNLTQYNKQILQKSKTKFDALDSVNFAGDEPRIVKITRYLLAHSGYEFCNERFAAIVEEQNRLHTLSYNEICAFSNAMTYVFLEKLALTLDELCQIAKMHKYAMGGVTRTKLKNSLMKNKLYLAICAYEMGYNSKKFEVIFANALKTRMNLIAKIIEEIAKIEHFDFSRYYTPLEILDGFEVFAGASVGCKHNFLFQMQKLAFKENIDELLFAVRLQKYMQSASGAHFRIVRANFAVYKFCIVRQKCDISMLACALTSHYMMEMIFGYTKRKSSKSIANINLFENSFEPIYKFECINIGLSTNGNMLRINRRLPKNVLGASIVFAHNGCEHKLNVLRSNDDKLFVNGTEVCGISELRLGASSLDIEVHTKG